MELIDYLRVVKDRWISMALVLLVCLGVAGIVILVSPVRYTATTETLLLVVQGNSPGDLVSGASFTQSQVDSFASIATSARVLVPAMRELGIDEPVELFAGRVTANVLTGTVIIAVSATGATPAEASSIADAVADALVVAVQDMTPMAADGSSLVKATVIAPALLPTAPSAPSVNRLLVLGVGVGLGLGYAQALTRQVLGRRVRDEDDVAAVTHAPVIARVRFNPDVHDALAAIADPQSATQLRDYHKLATNLQFLGFGRGRLSVVLTSVGSRKGTTTLAIILASLLRHEGAEILLIDGNLRHPDLGNRLGMDSSVGLTSILIGSSSFDNAIQVREGVHVLPSGPIPPNPGELLASSSADHLREAMQRFNYVIVDSAPILSGTDTQLLVKLFGEAVLVVGAGSSTRSQVGRAVEAVESVFGNVRGVVINQVKQGVGNEP